MLNIWKVFTRKNEKELLAKIAELEEKLANATAELTKKDEQPKDASGLIENQSKQSQTIHAIHTSKPACRYKINLMKDLSKVASQESAVNGNTATSNSASNCQINLKKNFSKVASQESAAHNKQTAPKPMKKRLQMLNLSKEEIASTIKFACCGSPEEDFIPGERFFQKLTTVMYQKYLTGQKETVMAALKNIDGYDWIPQVDISSNPYFGFEHDGMPVKFICPELIDELYKGNNGWSIVIHTVNSSINVTDCYNKSNYKKGNFTVLKFERFPAPPVVSGGIYFPNNIIAIRPSDYDSAEEFNTLMLVLAYNHE